jgi:hypothetical protein
MNLNREQFLRAVERGQVLLKELKKDYPELSLHPVFSRFGSRSGQCDLTTDLKKIVMEFPEMLASESFSRERAQRAQKENVDATPSSRSSPEGSLDAEEARELAQPLMAPRECDG